MITPGSWDSTVLLTLQSRDSLVLLTNIKAIQKSSLSYSLRISKHLNCLQIRITVVIKYKTKCSYDISNGTKRSFLTKTLETKKSQEPIPLQSPWRPGLVLSIWLWSLLRPKMVIHTLLLNGWDHLCPVQYFLVISVNGKAPPFFSGGGGLVATDNC